MPHPALPMLLQDLKQPALSLSAAERLALASAILKSLQTPEADWQYFVARPHP